MADEKTTTTKTSAPADHDRVVMASRRADGTPAQTAGFEYIGDKETAVEAAKVQLAEQAVSAVDVAKRGVTDTDGADQGNEPDPDVKALKKAHDAAAAAAEKRAESEVNAAHKGLGD